MLAVRGFALDGEPGRRPVAIRSETIWSPWWVRGFSHRDNAGPSESTVTRAWQALPVSLDPASSRAPSTSWANPRPPLIGNAGPRPSDCVWTVQSGPPAPERRVHRPWTRQVPSAGFSAHARMDRGRRADGDERQRHSRQRLLARSPSSSRWSAPTVRQTWRSLVIPFMPAHFRVVEARAPCQGRGRSRPDQPSATLVGTAT